VGLIGIVLASLFAASLVVAVGRPRPRAVPVAAVGGAGARHAIAGALEKAAGGGIEIRIYATELGAVRAISNQHVYGAVIASERVPKLLVSRSSHWAGHDERDAERLVVEPCGHYGVGTRLVPTTGPCRR
jgi:hypothetical protein